MRFTGSLIQNAIYIARRVARGRSAPTTGRRAREEVLDPGPFGYIAGGAGDESTMRANLEAFERRRLRPRMLTGQRASATSRSRCSARASPAPFFLAPIGVLSIAHADGELAVARAAAATRHPVHPLERRVALDRGDRRGDGRRAALVPALLGERPRDLRELRARARRRPGYGAIVVTLDTLTLGWRPRDLRNAYLPFLSGEGCAQFFTDPVFCARLDEAAGGGPAHRGGDDARDVPEPAA